MPMVVALIKKLLEDIFAEMHKEEFHPDKVEELVQDTCQKWKSFRVEIGEFRLMIILQVRIGLHFAVSADLPLHTLLCVLT